MTDIPFPGQNPYDRDQALYQISDFVALRKIGDFKNRDAANNCLIFKDIPQNFNHLFIFAQWRATRAGFQNTGLRFTLNAQGSGIHFSYYGMLNGAVQNGHATNQGTGYMGQTPAALSNAFNCSHHKIEIPFYTTRNSVKEALTYNNVLDGGANGHETLNVGNEFSGLVGAVTRIDISDDVGSVFDPLQTRAVLYGIL